MVWCGSKVSAEEHVRQVLMALDDDQIEYLMSLEVRKKIRHLLDVNAHITAPPGPDWLV